MTHAERALALIISRRPEDGFCLDEVEGLITALDAIEETREPQPEKKVPMPLKRDELRPLDLATGIVLGVDDLEARGLGIYKIEDVREACK